MKKKKDIQKIKSKEPIVRKKKAPSPQMIVSNEEKIRYAEHLKRVLLGKLALGIFFLILIGFAISSLIFPSSSECESHTCDTDPCLCLSIFLTIGGIIFFYLVYSLAKYQKKLDEIKKLND